MSELDYLLKDVSSGMYYCRPLPAVTDPSDHAAVAELVQDALNFLSSHGCTNIGVFTDIGPLRGAANGMSTAYTSTKYVYFRVSYLVGAPLVLENAHVDVPI